MKSHLPLILTIIVVAAGFGLTQRDRLSGLRQSEPVKTGPEEVIWRMTDAAREGNAQAYLDCFTGDLKQVLQRTASEIGEPKFREHLKQLNSEVTGIAVSNVEETPGQAVGATEAGASGQLRVEFIFRGKNETQEHYVKLVDGKWRIERIDDGQYLKALIPYGTSVKDALPALKRG